MDELSKKERHGVIGGLKEGAKKLTKQYRMQLAEDIMDVLNSPMEITDMDGNTATTTVWRAGLFRLFQQYANGNLKASEIVLNILDAKGCVDFLMNEAQKTLIADAESMRMQTIGRIFSFLDFNFLNKSNIIFVYGTTRSGKTYTIIQWMLTQLNEGTLTGQSLIAGQTVPFLRNGSVNYINELIHFFPNLKTKNQGFEVYNEKTGAKLLAQSFDDKNKALSAQWSLIFLNECNTLDNEVVDGLRIRCNGLIITDFNPSVNDWWGASEINDANKLFCSFKDNNFLNDTQLRNIEQIKERGESAPVGSYNHWYYQVYYLGNFSTLGGGVFTNIVDARDMAYPTDEDGTVEVFGCDFGDVTDPNTIVRCRYDVERKEIHVRCELYATAKTDFEMVEMVKDVLKCRIMVFETATGGNTRIGNWRALGVERSCRLLPAEKTSVSQGIYNLSQNKIFCHDPMTLKEFSEFRIINGKFKGADHCIDAVRYATHLIEIGAIRGY